MVGLVLFECILITHIFPEQALVNGRHILIIMAGLMKMRIAVTKIQTSEIKGVFSGLRYGENYYKI